MRVLYLGPSSRLVPFLAETDDVTEWTDPLPPEPEADFLVSYGYRHIIAGSILERFPQRAVNLHIAYLPWNRGADPNLWSHIEGTPKGVTIHHMDAGIDTGPIIAQRLVDLAPDDTLASSYQRLKDAMEDLFVEHWPAIRGGCPGEPQNGAGTYHHSRDKAAVEHLLSDGWDTRIAQLRPSQAQKRHRHRSHFSNS